MRLFDMHCDTIYECCMGNHHLQKNALQLDLERGLDYEQWAQAFAVWMPDSLRGDDAWKQCRYMLQFAHSEAAAYSQQMCIVSSAKDLDKAFQSHRCAAILTVEGGSALAGRLDTLDELAKLDVKIITLTWNGSNEWGHGCGSGCKEGLTGFGKQAVRRMEQLHLIPDVSHLNEQGFWDVMDCTQGPVIASHSVSAGICNHPRNLTDDQFCAIRDRGGLVGLTLCGSQLGTQTFDCLEKHLDHYLSLGGENMVGFGCDFDGTSIPKSWGGIEVLKEFAYYLQQKKYEEPLLERLFFGNCNEFFHKVL